MQSEEVPLDDVGVDLLELFLLEGADRFVHLYAFNERFLPFKFADRSLPQLFFGDRVDRCFRLFSWQPALVQGGERHVGCTAEHLLTDQRQAVEHFAAHVVRSGHEPVKQLRVRLPFERVGRDQVVQVHVAVLTDSVDASHPLLQGDQRPGDVPVDQHMGGLQVDAFVTSVGGHDHLEFAGHEPVADDVTDGVNVTAGVPLRAVPDVVELLDEPVGGVGVLGEHDQLLIVARQNPVWRQTGADHLRPFRGDVSRAGVRRVGQVRVDLGEQTLDRLLLVAGRRRIAEDHFRVVAGCRVVTIRVAVILVTFRFRAGQRPHTFATTTEGLCERVQAGCRSFAVHHPSERFRFRREVVGHQLQRLGVERVLDRGQRHFHVDRVPVVEQPVVLVIVQLFFHPAKEVHRAGLQLMGVLGVAFFSREHFRVDEVHQRPEQPFVPAMRRRGHQQRPWRLRQDTADAVERLSGRRQPVGLVEDDQIPSDVLRMDRFEDRRVHRRKLERHNPEPDAGDQPVT